MGSLKDKIIKNSTIQFTDVLLDSKLINEKNKQITKTEIPLINVALGGDFNGGLQSGLLMIAGPSKHFKSLFGLIMAKAYLEANSEAVLLLYDSEFGAPLAYFKSLGIDVNRVIHTPVTTIEELRHDLTVQMKNIERNDKVIILIDSVGNLASSKESKDALEGNEAADMTRAKVLKSLGRIITPQLTLKNIPLVLINHTYQEIGMFPKTIVSGGTGAYYSANDIWIIGRQQEKQGSEVVGYNFIINIEKSRAVREKSKFPISVTNQGGLSKYTGLFDLATELGLIQSPSKGYFQRAILDTISEEIKYEEKKLRRGEIETDSQYWEMFIENQDVNFLVSKAFKVGSSSALIKEKENTQASDE